MEIILYKCGGPYYLTRDGRRAVVTESNAEWTGEHFQHFWQGRIDGEPAEWDLDLRFRGEDRGKDLSRECPGNSQGS